MGNLKLKLEILKLKINFGFKRSIQTNSNTRQVKKIFNVVLDKVFTKSLENYINNGGSYWLGFHLNSSSRELKIEDEKTKYQIAKFLFIYHSICKNHIASLYLTEQDEHGATLQITCQDGVLIEVDFLKNFSSLVVL